MAVAQGISKQLKIVEQSALGSAGSSGSTLYRRVTSTFNLERDTYTSAEIVDHQQSTGATAGVGRTTGALNGELSAGTYAPLFSNLLRKATAATTPAASVGLTISAATAGVYPLVRAAGSWLTDGFKIGDIIRLSVGTLNAANIAKNLIIVDITSATAAKVVPLNGVALVAEGPITGCTVTVVGKKLWVPTSGHLNKYLSVEEYYADLTRSELFTDVKVASADVGLPATGIATVNFNMPGLARSSSGSEVLTSPTAASTSNVLTAVQGKVITFPSGGTSAITAITGAQITIDGGITPGEAEVGSNSISDMVRGRVSVSGSFTAKFSSVTLQDVFNNQTQITLIFTIADSASATAEFVTFVMSNVKLFSDTANDGGVEIIRTYNFTAAINGSGHATTNANHQTIISIQDSLAA
jgi:hypothetical protein